MSNDRLDALCEELENCKYCPYQECEENHFDSSKGYGKFGCHTYSYKPKVMIGGQNPSHNRFPYPSNHSLSGNQGDLFRELFGKENLILTNLVQVSSPDNKIRTRDIEHGFFHLKKEIDFYKPELIIGLGTFCRKALANIDRVVFLRHPNYYLTYNPSQYHEYVAAVKEIHHNYTL